MGRKAVCAFLSVIGMVLISGAAGSGSLKHADLTGILLGLGAAALYACVVISNKKTQDADPFRKTVLQLLAAGIVMIPYLFLTDGFSGISFDPSVLLLVLAVGLIIHTVIAYALYFGSMKGMSVQSIAMLSYIDPVSALLFSSLLLKEPLSLMQIAGACLIIGSALLSEMKRNATA